VFLTVEWLRHIVLVFVLLFSSPWRWSDEWPKHVGDYNKITFIHLVAFVRLFNNKIREVLPTSYDVVRDVNNIITLRTKCIFLYACKILYASALYIIF
jgi:hypothetical protein